MNVRLLRIAALGGAVASLLTACATTTGPMPPNNQFLVAERSAQFFKYGPAQAFGPDFTLKQGDKVTMLDKQFGYSKVQLEDGMVGYVSTDELKPAPPPPPPLRATPKPKAKSSRSGGSWFSSGKPKRSNVQPTPDDPLFDVTDIPLPMPADDAQPALPKP